MLKFHMRIPFCLRLFLEALEAEAAEDAEASHSVSSVSALTILETDTPHFMSNVSNTLNYAERIQT